MRPFYRKLILVLLFVSSPALARVKPQPPTLAEIPAVCLAANRSVSDALQEGIWRDFKIDPLSDTELAKVVAVEVWPYYPFMIYNSPSPRLAKWITRYGIALWAKNYPNENEDNPTAADLIEIKPAVETLREILTAALADPAAARISDPIEFLEICEPYTRWGKMESLLPYSCAANRTYAECRATTAAILEHARPYACNSNLVPGFFDLFKYLTSPRYISGLSRYNLSGLDRFQREEAGELPTPVSDVVTDLERAFLDSSMTPSDARDAAMMTLKVYGTRGASFGAAEWPTGVPLLGLGLLSHFISYFDRLQVSRGEPSYFLPASVRINCSYGKPYHFWMAAGLSYFASRSGYPPATSAFTSHLLGVGYEVFADYNDRDYRKVLKLPRFDPYVNHVRADVFFKTLGAFYGASEGAPGGAFSGDFDVAFHHQFHASRSAPQHPVLPSLVVSTTLPNPVKVQRWFRLIAPSDPLPEFRRRLEGSR